MGYYTDIYGQAKKQAIEDARMWTRFLLHDAEEFEEDGMELFEFCNTLNAVSNMLRSVADEVCISKAKDVATDLLIDDADFPQMYTQMLIAKDRSALEEITDRLWRSGDVEDCTYAQVRLGVERAWEELEQTSFEGCVAEEEA